MIISTIIEIIGIIAGFFWIKFWLGVEMDDDNPALWGLLGLTPGFIFYWLMTNRYRNMNARHFHEKETKSDVKNIKKSDNLLEHRKRLSNSRIAGENDNVVKGVLAKNGKAMMGEKMANFIGIGRMAGSTPDQTPAGQRDEAAVNKMKTTKTVITIIIIMFVLFFIFMMF